MAQSTRFNEFVNQLYFNVLTVNPDPAISEYIEKNIPIYAKRNNNGAWVAIGGSSIDWSLMEYNVDTFYFTTHPYFHETFKTGSFISLIRTYRKKFDNVCGWYLSFDFESKSDIKKAYENLVDSFTVLSTKHEIENTGQMKISKFFNNDPKTLFQPVLVIEWESEESNTHQIILGVDYLMKRFSFLNNLLKESSLWK